MSAIYQTAAAQQARTKNDGATPVQQIDADGSAVSNDEVSLLASGVVTANGNTADMTNSHARGLLLYIKTGSFGASESTLVVTIEGKTPGGDYYTILASASLSASTSYILRVYPTIAASGNLIAQDVLPRTWRVKWSASNWGTGGSTLGIWGALVL